MRILPLLLILLVPNALAQGGPDSLRTAIANHLQARGEQDIPPYRYALADLNGDNRDDAIVLLVGPFWCGTGGCTMLVFRATDEGGYSFVSDSSVTIEPIRVGAGANNGWKNLIVDTKGPGDVVLAFDGTRYPANPSTQPRATAAQISAAKTILGD